MSEQVGLDQGWELLTALRPGIADSGITPQQAQVSWVQRPMEARLVLAEMLRLGPDAALRRLRGEPASEDVLERFLAPPANLELWFEIQAETFRRLKVGKEAGMDDGKSKDIMMTAARDFRYRPDLTAIGLTECFLVPYGIRLEFWLDVGGITNYLDLSACHNYQGVVTPGKGEVWPVQGQFGEKYRNKKPRWCRENLHVLEQGMTLEERLAAHVLFGPMLLGRIFSDIIGSVSEDGSVPCLDWSDDRPRLLARWDVSAFPVYGGASRGSV